MLSITSALQVLLEYSPSNFVTLKEDVFVQIFLTLANASVDGKNMYSAIFESELPHLDALILLFVSILPLLREDILLAECQGVDLSALISFSGMCGFLSFSFTFVSSPVFSLFSSFHHLVLILPFILHLELILLLIDSGVKKSESFDMFLFFWTVQL